MSKAFWDERYAANDLIYGDAPNDFLTQMANRFGAKGDALDIGAGQGRNALFLASLGLNVLAVDQSEVGLQKAQQLANERGLSLRTQAVDLCEFETAPNSLDVVSSIFVHLPTPLREKVHRGVRTWLKPGGFFVLEVYSPDQLKRDTGGPKDPELFAPLDVILAELDGLVIEHRAELVRNVVEGSFHTGEACVLQILARKP